MIATRDVKAQLKSSFWTFKQALWHSTGWHRYHPLGWVDELKCEHVQNGHRLAGDLSPRSWGKTHELIAEMLWDFYRNPDSKDLVISKSEGHAKKALKKTRALIDQISWLRHLTPGDGQAWSDTTQRFDIGTCTPATQASLEVYGIEGQLPGNRASKILADDIETRQNTITADSRDALREITAEFRNISTWGDARVYIRGTPHHPESVYLSLIERGYDIVSYPLCYPTEDEKVINLHPVLREKLESGKVAPGSVVADYRFDEAYVNDKKAEGAINFAMQQMMIADLADEARYPFRLADFITFPADRKRAPTFIAWGKDHGQGTSTAMEDVPSLGFGSDRFYAPAIVTNRPEEYAEYEKKVMVIDPAGRGGDQTGYCVCGGLAGLAWWLCVDGEEEAWGTASMARLIKIGHSYFVREFHIERNFGGDPAVELFRSELARYIRTENPTNESGDPWGAVVFDYHSTGQKELRIADTLEPALASHRVVIHPSVARNQKLQMQLTRFTRDRNSLGSIGDDQLEAAAKAVEIIQSGFRDDPESARQRQKDAIIEAKLNQMREKYGAGPVYAAFYKP